MSYPGNKGSSSLADATEATGERIPPSSRFKKRSAEDLDEGANMTTKRAVQPKRRVIIDDSDSESVAAQLPKSVKSRKGKVVSKPAVSDFENLPKLASVRPRRNLKPAVKDDTDPYATDTDDENASEVDEEDAKANIVIPRLIDGKVVGSDMSPEEFLEKQKRGHWGTGRIGKNKSPNRRKRRVGATPKETADMDAGDWIIVNMHLKNKSWKEIDAAWSDWSKKPSSAKDHTVVRNRYEKLEKMLCAELNLDINTNLLVVALNTLRDEKKVLDEELIAYQVQHAKKVQKLQDKKFDRIAATMTEMGAKKDVITPAAVEVRHHFLTNRRFLSDEGKWIGNPLDTTTPGATTAARKRAPKKKATPGTDAAQNALGESSPVQADVGDYEQGYDDLKQEKSRGRAYDDGGEDFEEEDE